MADLGSGSLWEWFATRMASAPMRGSGSPAAALFLQADMAARRGDRPAALGLVEQVIGGDVPPPLLLAAAQSFRATLLEELGRPADALAAAQAATVQARGLAPSGPGHRAALPRALRGEAVMLARSQRLTEALAASEEAVSLARELPGEEAVLAEALATQAGTLDLLGRRPDAVAAGEAALALLHGAEPSLGLARALDAHARRLHPDDARRALALVDEAVGTLRRLDQGSDDVRRSLASALAFGAHCHRQAAHVPELVESAREALDLHLSLPHDLAADPQVLTGPVSLLADGLFKLSVLQARSGDLDAALATNAEALEAFEELARLAPGRHRDGVGLSLVNRGSMLLQTGRDQEAVETYVGAVAALRTASKDAGRDPQLALALVSLTSARLRTGCAAEAVESATEAAEIRERLYDEDPARMAVPLSNAIDLLAQAFGRSGQVAEAEAMAAWSRELVTT